MPGIERGLEPGWEPHGRTTSQFSGLPWTADRNESEVTDWSERIRVPTRVSTDQKAGGSNPSERAQVTGTSQALAESSC